MVEIVAVDIGGTHARFAVASIENGRVASLRDECTLKTSEHAGLESAWKAYGARGGRKLPDAAAIAVAAPIEGEALKLTNYSWVIQPSQIPKALGVERFILVNDFGAVAHAVAQVGSDQFSPLAGPDRDLPEKGVITIVGPGTGLGVAMLIRGNGEYRVIETEGGHIDFAPLDELEDYILPQLRQRFGRVSAERVVSGRGLMNIYETLAAIERQPIRYGEEKALWQAAMAGEDGLPASALDRFCRSLGSIAGDIALAQGADAVVIGGGLGRRLADYLPRSGFGERFAAKGRFERRMREIPVKLITYPEPGLYGAAAAFAAQA